MALHEAAARLTRRAERAAEPEPRAAEFEAFAASGERVDRTPPRRYRIFGAAARGDDLGVHPRCDRQLQPVVRIARQTLRACQAALGVIEASERAQGLGAPALELDHQVAARARCARPW